MPNYFNLNRRFVERETYDLDEIIASDFRGKRLEWSKVQEGRFSVIVAPANFGKTTEMACRAKQMREEAQAAVFIALRRLAERGSFERALETDESAAYLSWKSSSTGPLTIFVDSLDEAAAGKNEGIEYLVRDIADEVSWPNDQIRWVIATRPAVLTPQVLAKLAEILVGPASRLVQSITLPSSSDGKATSIKASASASTSTNEREKLRIFSMVSLDSKQAETYLVGRYADLPPREILRFADEKGLSGFTESPGGLDILARIDLLANPPKSLTEIYERVVVAVQTLRSADVRLEDAGRPDPEMLGQAARKLAAASQVCQILNIEMPEETLEIPEKALSARLIVAPRLTERAINQLLNSQLFIDVGFHQVKLYPNELAPFLAAQRLAELVQSPDQAHKLVQNFTWIAPSGEQGVHRQFLPLMGWLATLNTHCREKILKCDPQALAFFGDLRNPTVSLGAAEEALVESIRRLVEQGDRLGRGMFTLTSENFWQAGPKRLAPVIIRLFDLYESHRWARDALLDIVVASRSDALRKQVLRAHGSRYERVLTSSIDVRYLLELKIESDLIGLARAVKGINTAKDSVVAMLLTRLGWAYFGPSELARIVDFMFSRDRHLFHIGYIFESGGLLESANEGQIYQLARAMVVRMARVRDRQGASASARIRSSEKYVEMTVEVVTSLVERAAGNKSVKVAQICLVLQRALADRYFDVDAISKLKAALQRNSSVRRALLSMVLSRFRSNEHELKMAIFGYRAACRYEPEDIESLNDSQLREMQEQLEVARVEVQSTQSRITPVRQRRDEKLKIDSSYKKHLLSILSGLQDGTATGDLAFIAGWLIETNPNSRYGEINFEVFEQEVGEVISRAVRKGLGEIWRHRQPAFDEGNARTTYHSTIAGLQGLHLELGDGDSLPALTEDEVRQALRYGAFEINGYPKWFWKLAKIYPAVAIVELSKLVGDAPNGAVSSEHAEQLLTELEQAPNEIRHAFSSLAWKFLIDANLLRDYVVERILPVAMGDPSGERKEKFEHTALAKMKTAFKSPLIEKSDVETEARKGESVVWASHWLASYSESFRKAINNWGPKDPAAVKNFIVSLAAYFGRDRGGVLIKLAQESDQGVSALEELYRWTMWAVPPDGDIERPEGRVYTLGARDNAQQFRDGLIPAIASAKSQRAYEVLDRLRQVASGPREMYLKKVQFEMREAQYARPPLRQANYGQFEQSLRTEVTDFVSFAMAVHSDLLEVKYDIEYGEHSLRRFFSELVFKAANRKGPEGAAAGLALEADFQSLLASEINHHARGRYSVTVESNTAEAKRRDVLCSRGEWHASVELKMSMRWTLDDYVEALEKQLVGQYMRHRRAAVGFLVVVLQQKGRQWRDPATAKLVGFDEVLEILRGKAQAIEANDRTKYLRVIGIDATTPQNFRKTGQGTTRKDPLTVVAQASSGKARSPRPTGGQPAVKLPRADRAPKAAVRRVRSVRTR